MSCAPGIARRSLACGLFLAFAALAAGALRAWRRTLAALANLG